MKLQGKILVPVITLIVIGMTALAMISIIMVSSELEESYKRNIEQVTSITAQSVDSWINERVSDIEVASIIPLFVKTLSSDGDQEIIDKANLRLQDKRGTRYFFYDRSAWSRRHS